MRKRPRVTTRCVADHYAAPKERIVEVSDSRGLGCLISFWELDNGTLAIKVYRADRGVWVHVPGADPLPAHREDTTDAQA